MERDAKQARNHAKTQRFNLKMNLNPRISPTF